MLEKYASKENLEQIIAYMAMNLFCSDKSLFVLLLFHFPKLQRYGLNIIWVV